MLPTHRVASRPVRLVIAKCSVSYVGRLTAHLPLATRLLMVKADGSVLVHSDHKPLNWMSPPCTLAEADLQWTVTNKAGEQLVVTIDGVLRDSAHELGVDPGLVKDGVEAHLQRLLAEQIEILGTGYRLVRREYPTAIGPVDVEARDVVRRRCRGRDQATRRDRRSRTADPLPPTCSIVIRCSHPSRVCSPRRRSSRRPAPSRRTAASAASRSTTTRCAGSTTRPCACSDRLAAPQHEKYGGNLGVRSSKAGWVVR